MATDDRSWLTPVYPELRDGPPWVMHDMVLAERELPAATAALDVGPLAAAVRAAVEAGAPLVVVGCGTSEHGAQGVARLLEDALGGPGVEARQAFEAALEPRRGGLCLAVSHGGSSNATNAALEAAAATGARTAVITATPEGRTAGLASLVLDTGVRDRSWCHTIGYLGPLLAGGALAAALGGPAFDPGALRAHIEAADAACAGVDELARRLADCAQLVTLGSGVDRIAARELALKVEEASYVPTALRDTETFLHGHLPACDAGTGLVVVVSDPLALAQRAARAADALRAARRCDVVTLALVTGGASTTIEPALTSAGRVELPDAPGRLEALAGTAIALQRLTLALAAARGTNPDLLRREHAPYREARDLSATKS